MVTLTVGHSPDPDDAFMFYGLATGRIDTGSLRFEFVAEDIQTLNDRALRGELDITAVSFGAYPAISRDYALLPCGASVGDGYGPVLVARKPMLPLEVATCRVAAPGRLTSAFLALQLWLGRPAAALNARFVPFDQVFAAVQSGEADAGLVIHEGQLTYERDGLALIVDLGRWWNAANDGLPLPLGAEVIHRRVPAAMRCQAARWMEASIRYSLAHRAEAVGYSMAFARGLGVDLADRFVGMYVNEWTLDYGDRGRESIRRFFAQGVALGAIPVAPELEFVALS